MYDLSSEEEKQVTVNESWQEGPAIYENRIVWTDMRNSNLTPDDWMQWNVDIYMYDLTSGEETQITTDGSNQLLPAIHGDSIVWEDYRNHAEATDINPILEELQWNSDIYMYNISSQEEKQITVNESSQEYPAIYEEKIVWVDMRNGYLDIYMTTLTGQGLQS
jgi:beta propeller repeat protein